MASRQDDTIQSTVIGCGSMARHHLRIVLSEFKNTIVPVVCEPSQTAYHEMCELFEEAGREIPENEPDYLKLLASYGDQLDAAFIITPHVFHHDQAVACMEYGLDVLLEKPMVMTAAEAQSLIDISRETGRLLTVAFNGSLSPEIRAAANMLRSGELGSILSISATIWQNWRAYTDDTWRQRPALSGGGFLFDTGAHMLNTVADLAEEEFVEVAAWLDNQDAPVEINAVVMARLANGALVTLHGSGNTIPSCASDIRVFCTDGILRTGAWGRWLEVQRSGKDIFEKIQTPQSTGVWEQFLEVRSGFAPNPCPPEVGLRMARLWDAIKESALRDGRPVICQQ
ncbi:MAG: Gfo/Idh/MocA family protein [Candidatus Promineifilaceae bacterium]